MYNRRPPMPPKASLKRPTKQLPRPTRLSPVRRTRRRAQHPLLRVALKIAGHDGVERARPQRVQVLIAAQQNQLIPRRPAASLHRHPVQLSLAHPHQVDQPLAHPLRALPLRTSRPVTNHRQVPRRLPATKAAAAAKAVAVKAAASRLP